jgi:CheY-like chemotaxis protein
MKKIDKILLVDDDEVANFLNQLIIERLGVAEDLEIVLNGQEALDYLKEYYQHADQASLQKILIVLDLNMPVMNGFDFLEELEKQSHWNKTNRFIVILTSSENPSDIEGIKNYSIYGYEKKPLTEEKLKKLISSIV